EALLRVVRSLPTRRSSDLVEVIVYPEDFEMCEASLAAAEDSNQVKTNVKILQNWAIREPRGEERRLHLHFLHRPVEVLGTDRVRSEEHTSELQSREKLVCR